MYYPVSFYNFFYHIQNGLFKIYGIANSPLE